MITDKLIKKWNNLSIDTQETIIYAGGIILAVFLLFNLQMLMTFVSENQNTISLLCMIFIIAIITGALIKAIIEDFITKNQLKHSYLKFSIITILYLIIAIFAFKSTTIDSAIALQRTMSNNLTYRVPTLNFLWIILLGMSGWVIEYFLFFIYLAITFQEKPQEK